MKNSVIQLGKCVALHMTVVAVKMQRIRPMPHLTFGIAGQAAKTNPKKVHINIIISVSVSIYNHFFSFQSYKFLLNPLILSQTNAWVFVWVNLHNLQRGVCIFVCLSNATSGVHIRQPQEVVPCKGNIPGYLLSFMIFYEILLAYQNPCLT